MEVRPGYKQTEVGAIPDDWDVVLLDTVTKRGSGHTPDKAHPEYWGGGIKWVSLQDSDQLDRLYIWDTAAKITPAGIANSSARMHPQGTVVLSRDAGVGKSAIMKDDMAVSQHFMAWTCGPSLDNHFLYYWLQSNKFEFERIAMGNTIKTIGLPYFRQLVVPLPTKAEQEAIAEALSDGDALIESLEQLLAKKRQLKQGAMQELLTGKKRLPGFSGGWEIVNLDGVVDRITGVWGANDSSPDHPRCTAIIRAGDISQDGLLTGSAQRFLSDPEFSKAHCRLDDIVITTSGNGLGKVWWCDGRPNVAASNFVRILRPVRGKSQGRYLSYLLRSEAGLKQLQEHTATSAYPNLRPSFFAATWLSLPSLSEQIVIAAILSDMDADIAALQATLAKARRIKQGMMQELLTGRIRFV